MGRLQGCQAKAMKEAGVFGDEFLDRSSLDHVMIETTAPVGVALHGKGVESHGEGKGIDGNDRR
jgi:hypothetical protein